MALVGNGQLYNVEVKAGEQYIAHPRYDHATEYLGHTNTY